MPHLFMQPRMTAARISAPEIFQPLSIIARAVCSVYFAATSVADGSLPHPAKRHNKPMQATATAVAVLRLIFLFMVFGFRLPVELFRHALAAIGSAWYAKVQSDYSALSARASAGSIATLPATPASTPKLPASTPATATHSATPTP